MTEPKNRRSRPAGNGPALSSSNATTTTVRLPDDVLVAHAVWSRPRPGRLLHGVAVLDCPHCHTVHLHYSGGTKLFGGTAVRRCSASGQRYVLAVDTRAGAVA